MSVKLRRLAGLAGLVALLLALPASASASASDPLHRRAAQISQGYLHKLEAGRVNTPSPRVLERLGTVLGIPYERLMELAGYVPPRPQEATMPRATAPTNHELARLLEAVLKELIELKHGQHQLAEGLKAR